SSLNIPSGATAAAVCVSVALNLAAMKPLLATGLKMKNAGVACSTVAISTALVSSRGSGDPKRAGSLAIADAVPQLEITVKLTGPKVFSALTLALISVGVIAKIGSASSFIIRHVPPRIVSTLPSPSRFGNSTDSAEKSRPKTLMIDNGETVLTVG